MGRIEGDPAIEVIADPRPQAFCAGYISSERVDSLFGHATRWRPPLWLTAASLASLITLGLLVWRVGELASVHATLSLPFLSSEPCVVMSPLLLALGGFAIAKRTLASGVRLPAGPVRTGP